MKCGVLFFHLLLILCFILVCYEKKKVFKYVYLINFQMRERVIFWEKEQHDIYNALYKIKNKEIRRFKVKFLMNSSNITAYRQKKCNWKTAVKLLIVSSFMSLFKIKLILLNNCFNARFLLLPVICFFCHSAAKTRNINLSNKKTTYIKLLFLFF